MVSLTQQSVSAKNSANLNSERSNNAFIPALLDDFGLDVYEFRVYCRRAL